MRSSVRWLVPVTVAATVAGGAVLNSAAAGNSPQLPSRTPQQVLEAVAGSKVTALSGTVVTRTDLGLPTLPQLGAAGSAPTDVQGVVTRFLSGKNTLRVWADGPTRQRVQLLDSFDELDVVRNGDQVWTYASKQNEVRHGTLAAQHAGRVLSPKASPGATAGAEQLTPAEAAKQALAAADPTTTVTLGDPRLVAGRPAYSLVLTPKTSATLVDHVVIAVDAARSVPLQVQVYARGKSQPAVETGFTAVDFATPSASQFTFTPPKGATVKPLENPMTGSASGSATPGASGNTGTPGSAGTHPRPTVTGTGWNAIVELPAGSAPAALTGASTPADSTPSYSGKNSPGPGTSEERSGMGSASGQALFDQLTTKVSGGRAVTSSLVSVLITDDGRVLAGAVPVQALVDAAKK